MAAINDLIRQITDPDLRDRIQKEVDKLAKQKKFGLVFEEHLPECTPLYDIPVRRGVKAALKAGDVSDFYQVLKVEDGKAICKKRGETEAVEFPVDDLVTIAEFGEAIYPYLKPIDTVCNAPDSDLWHTLIEADNYHALQLLEYLYAGKVDCIYIDPPYNTGARDWKYNNDYVDSGDIYRHSKWLSFMEKRLTIAKRLLNPDTGVLIVTIDEHEVHRLRMLLDEIFSDYYIQMVTYVTSPSGASQGRFSRIEEYAIYCFAKNAYVEAGNDPMIGEIETSSSVRWKSLLRSGPSSSRADRKNMFYPIYVDPAKGTVVKVGDPLPFELQPDFSPVDGHPVVWPIRTDGSQGRWSVGADTFKELVSKGYVQLGRYDEKRNTYGITYISSQTQQMIENGEVIITGRDKNTGIVQVEYANAHAQAIRTVWYRTRHNAGSYGTNLIASILGKGRKFSFPKSLYATRDSIYSIVKGNKNALIVDFFAGSGTTLHAVNLMNTEDCGHRRCIIVTNNEVSELEAKELSAKGYKPGDDYWEKYGIAQNVTWPRTVCSILGRDTSGNLLQGDYISDNETPLHMSDGFKANAAFLKLGFLNKTSIALGMQFKEMLPILWMKAGAIGKLPDISGSIPDMLILPENRFAVLINENVFAAFEEAVHNTPEVQTVFIVTDYEVNYRSMVKSLGVETSYQLYRDYLDNFRINHGRN
jgi:adenine-specific DNA-methyltransferase